MRKIFRRSRVDVCVHDSLSAGWRPLAARIGGLGLLLGIVVLPLFALNVSLFFWDSVPINGFAASTGWLIVDLSGTEVIPTNITLVSIVGHNTTGTNQYQLHQSSNLPVGLTLTDTIETLPLTFQPTVSTSISLPLADNGCCAAPNAVANDDDSVSTAFTGGDGKFRILRTDGTTTTSTPIDPAANGQLSAALQAVGGTLGAALVAATSDTINQTLDGYLLIDGSTSWTQVFEPPCTPPTQNYHFAITANPTDDWVATVCREGLTIFVRQNQLPAGTEQWSVNLGTLQQAPNAFRYQGAAYCGGDTEFADQSTGQAIAYAIPRNNDMVVGMLGPVGTAATPTRMVDTILPGTANDYYGFFCEGNIVTIVRQDIDGSGMRFDYVNFNDLNGSVSKLFDVDDSVTPVWANVAPTFATRNSDVDPDERFNMKLNYLPVIFKTSGSLRGVDQVVYGSVPAMLFFDGFESGDTSSWDNAVGLAADE
jgi:hypothetical protein